MPIDYAKKPIYQPAARIVIMSMHDATAAYLPPRRLSTPNVSMSPMPYAGMPATFYNARR